MAQDTKRQDSSMNKDSDRNVGRRDSSFDRDSKKDAYNPSTDKKDASRHDEKFNKR